MLLLSLETRRPEVAQRLREDSPQELASILNKDPILIRAMEAERLSLIPSAFLPAPHTISEHMFIRLVDNQNIGGRLINAHWRVVRLGPRDGTLILSDRPLVRLFGYDNPKAAWFLPLSPKAVYYAAYSPIDLEGLTPRRLAKRLNADSVRQAQKKVFCVDGSQEFEERAGRIPHLKYRILLQPSLERGRNLVNQLHALVSVGPPA